MDALLIFHSPGHLASAKPLKIKIGVNIQSQSRQQLDLITTCFRHKAVIPSPSPTQKG